MKKKIVTITTSIESCQECPYQSLRPDYPHSHESVSLCTKIGGYPIIDARELPFPKWCPLREDE
jgi:hypothetical protein